MTSSCGNVKSRKGQGQDFTFSIKHLRDVQELLSHFKGSVQVSNRVVLEKCLNITYILIT